VWFILRHCSAAHAEAVVDGFDAQELFDTTADAETAAAFGNAMVTLAAADAQDGLGERAAGDGVRGGALSDGLLGL